MRGFALPMVLVGAVLIESLTLLALYAAIIQARLTADGRGRIEGQLIVSTALATTRIGHRRELDTLGDGAVLDWPAVSRPDGWTWRARAERRGAIIRLLAKAERRSADGAIFAARRATLLLVRDTADTVRVLGRRPRF